MTLRPLPFFTIEETEFRVKKNKPSLGCHYYPSMDPLTSPLPQFPLQGGGMHAFSYDVRSERIVNHQEFGVSGPEPVHFRSPILPIQAPTKPSKKNASDAYNEGLIDWASIRKPFEKLYKAEGRNLTDTMEILEDEYNFKAS